MPHRDARLTSYSRRKLVEQVLPGHKPSEVATQFHASRTSVYKRVRRWRAEGEAG